MKMMKVKHLFQLILYNIQMAKLFIKNTEGNIDEDRKDYIIAVAAHTVEKGLGCSSYKSGWGREKVIRLLHLIEEYAQNEYNQERFGFSEAIAVVSAYIIHKNQQGEDISEIELLWNNINKKYLKNIKNYNAGKELILKSDLQVNEEYGEKLLLTCRSIRNYSDRRVEEQDILSAIQLASRAPSACNRQPVKCYYTLDEKKIAECDMLVPGNGSIKGQTPNFIVITSSRKYFGLYEYDQWYVNGGIFMGYLRIALHVRGIGNCIYQWPTNADETKIKKLYGIPKAEAIIGIMGIGYFPDKAHCIYAQRKSIEEIAIKAE